MLFSWNFRIFSPFWLVCCCYDRKWYEYTLKCSI
jgi:hypothetical protein